MKNGGSEHFERRHASQCVYPRVHADTPQGKNYFKYQFTVWDSSLFQAKHIMADEDSETPEEDYADMPGLKEFSDTDCDSETSEEEYEPPKRTKRKRKGRRSQRVRGKKKRSPKKRNKRRRPVARNTTYASKRTCVDPDAVQDLFENQSCGCPKECIKMLKQLQDDGALDVVMQLRKERFACK